MYRVVVDDRTEHQIAALPAAALASFAELRTALEVGPWNGNALLERNPGGPVRTMTFGPRQQGMVTYLILDDQRRVDLLDVVWLS